MKKNVAIPLDVLRSGDQSEIEKYGLKSLTNEEIAQRNQDQISHDNYEVTEKYKDDRAIHYPPVSDQLDAIWKGLEALAAGAPLPEDTTAMLAAVKKVKDENPKPDKSK